MTNLQGSTPEPIDETPPSPAPQAYAAAGTPGEGAVPAQGRASSEPEPAQTIVESPEALDEGTFRTGIEPRGGGLAIEPGVWHRIAPQYIWVQLIANGAILAIVVAVMLVLVLVLHQVWAWIPGGIFAFIMLWTIAILPRQARSIGYRLREDDLVFRRGILWQRFVAVPYGRMQLVDITHGPLDRAFGIAQLKLVTAAATTGVTIPGLRQDAAEALRDHLIEVAESRRTGL